MTCCECGLLTDHFDFLDELAAEVDAERLMPSDGRSDR